MTTVNVAEVPLNATPVAPVKLEPVIETLEPTGPLEGVNPPTLGAVCVAVTVKLAELVAVPLGVVTEIVPVVAPVGTVAEIWPLLMTLNVGAVVPWNVTDVAPVKFVPLIVTVSPTAPLVGEKPLIVGVVETVPEQPGSENDPIRVSQLSSAFVVGCAS